MAGNDDQSLAAGKDAPSTEGAGSVVFLAAGLRLHIADQPELLMNEPPL